MYNRLIRVNAILHNQEDTMKRSLVLSLFAVICAVFYAVLCSTAVYAVSAQNPYAQNPYAQNPYAQNPYAGGKCNPGYTYTTYQGKQLCIKCNPDYSYTNIRAKSCASNATRIIVTQNIRAKSCASNATPAILH